MQPKSPENRCLFQVDVFQEIVEDEAAAEDVAEEATPDAMD